MHAITIREALRTIVDAAPFDCTFSTKIHNVLDQPETDIVYFLLQPITGELVDDGNLHKVYNIDCAIYQKMDEETDENERDESLSMLDQSMELIFSEFYQRHVVDKTTINGEELSVHLTTPPEIQTDWNSGEDNENMVQLTFSIQDEKAIACSTTLFSY